MATIKIYDAKQNSKVSVERIEKSDREWKNLLTEKQFEITTKKGTETPGWPSFYEPVSPLNIVE